MGRLEELKKTVSASRLNCFHSCRLKFYFRYVLELSKATSPALFFGKAVHWALQQWSKTRWRGGIVDPISLQTEFNSNWEMAQTLDQVDWEKDEETNQRDKAWGLVEMYLRETPIPYDEKPEGVEVVVEADLDPASKTREGLCKRKTRKWKKCKAGMRGDMTASSRKMPWRSLRAAGKSKRLPEIWASRIGH